MKLRLIGPLAALCFAATACASPEEGMRSADPSSGEESKSPSESPTQTVSATPSPSPAKTSSSAPSPAQVEQELTGFGATVEAWERVHGESIDGYTEGSVYGPIVRDDVHKYFGVIAEDRIYSYSRGFPEGTDLRTAERLILEDFPPDARVTVRDDEEDGCLILLVKSEAVREAVDADAIVGFFSEGDRLNRNDVSDANVFLGSEPGPDLGFC